MQTKMLVLVAGAALGLTASAFAQNANLDQGRAYNAELMSDAGNRASLLQSGGPAGNSLYAGTFGIGDSTGNNRLNIGGTSVTRYSVSMRDDSSVGDVEDLTIGFSQPTTRLRFWGNVWDKNLTFKISGNFGGEFSDGVFGLEDAYGMYTWDNGFGLKWGQFRMPVQREFSVEDEFQLTADRSVVSRVFSPGYTQGLQFSYQADAFRFVGGITDGTNSANTDFNSESNDLAVNLRFDFKAMGGSFERFNDMTSWRSAPDSALLIGVGVNWESGGETGGTVDNGDTFLYSIDASWEGPGFNVMAAGYGAHFSPPAGSEVDDFGAMIQAGIFVSDQIELFGRWDSIFWDDDRGFAEDTNMFATVGMNYYISKESHAAKFTLQAAYAFEDTTTLFGTGGFLEGNTRNGFLGDSDEGEISFIAQMQLVF